MRYVIIGNSAAAIGAIEGIRSYDRKGQVKVISKEPYLAYSRPLVTYYLAGLVDSKEMFYRDQSFYRRNKVDLRLGQEAKSLDTKSRKVKLSGGKQVPYDKLLIATGGVPFVPPVKGRDRQGVLTFTTWDEAKQMAKLSKNLSHVVVLGGGLIGLKTAEALRKRGVKVTIVELADRILSLTLDQRASRLIERCLAQNGIKTITQNTVTEITGDDSGVSGVVLKSGDNLACEAVVLAIGVIPNIQLAQGTSIKTDQGLITDDYMETSVPDIYAAGDVAQAPVMHSRGKMVIPIWPNAYQQGKVAGANMAGAKENYPGGLIINSVEVFGLPTIAVRLATPAEGDVEILKEYDAKKMIYKKLVLKNDVIREAIFVNAIDRAGVFTELIKTKAKVKKFKKELLRNDFGYIYFPQSVRVEKLQV